MAKNVKRISHRPKSNGELIADGFKATAHLRAAVAWMEEQRRKPGNETWSPEWYEAAIKFLQHLPNQEERP